MAGADVFLSASAQKTLTSVRCDECGQALLAWQLGRMALLAAFLSGFIFVAPMLALGLHAVARDLESADFGETSDAFKKASTRSSRFRELPKPIRRACMRCTCPPMRTRWACASPSAAPTP